MKATRVDGIYSSDPKLDKDAQKFKGISYLDVLNRGLKVMDSTAISMCMDNRIPIIVFDLFGEDNILNIVLGKDIGTIVEENYE